VQDFGYACTTLAQTNLRNLIGDRTLDETLVARDMINTNLRHVLDEATKWLGRESNACGSAEDRSPRDITEAMSRQMKAERDKRAFDPGSGMGSSKARILQAEGVEAIGNFEGGRRCTGSRDTRESPKPRRFRPGFDPRRKLFFKDRAEVMRRLEV